MLRPCLRHIFAVCLLLVPAGLTAKPLEDMPPEDTPLLTWSVLRGTHYLPGGSVEWEPGLQALDGQLVRLEGYLIPNYGAQDKGDLLLSALNPISLFCGPTDMTALVEVYIEGFDPRSWPELPVEVWGKFELSDHPENLLAIYRLRADGWRRLWVWEQSFPGIEDDPDRNTDNDDRGS